MSCAFMALIARSRTFRRVYAEFSLADEMRTGAGSEQSRSKL